MKKIIFILSILIKVQTFSQLVITFEKAGEQNLRGEHMDSIYHSGIQADSTLSVFRENEEEYIKAYEQLLQDLGKYLKANEFKWEEPTKGFNRIYFNENGKIDYFIYSFRTELSEEQKQKFDSLLNQFIKDYQFPLKASCKFAQCSPVTYMPAEE